MPIVSEPLGRVLGNRYKLVAALGSGASAHVFLAEDMVLQRRVAVKVLQPALAQDEAFLRRFRAEARSVAALNHPAVLRVFDWGEGDDGPYLVLEYLEGGSLFDMLSVGRRLSVAHAARIGAQAADGLAYAHARGIVHRDVKPANILFDEDGRVRVADFGVARALSSASTTDPGSMLGTARYSSPEQAQGLGLDGRSDVYSLALVLYEALIGEVPFARETPRATLQARIGAWLPTHSELGPLAQLLTTAAAPDPAHRYDAGVFAQRLQRLNDELSAGGPLPLVRRAPVDGTLLPDPDLAAHSFAGVWYGSDVDATSMVCVPAAGAEAFIGGVDLDDDGARGGHDAAVIAPDATSAVFVPSSQSSEAALMDSGEPTATIALGDGNGFGVPHFADGRRGERRRWPRVAGVVVLVACIVAAGLIFAVREHVFGGTDHVPVVVGDTLASARHALLEDHYVVKVEPAADSTSVAAGKVIQQVPSSGTLLSSGSTVKVFPSKGLPIESVPSLSANVDCVIARQLLGEVHLQAKCPGSSAYSTSVPQGDAVSWVYGGTLDPKTAPYGATIAVTVSSRPPPVVVASLAGESWTQASGTLAADGLVAKEVGTYSTTVAAGDVIATSPPAGTTLTAGSSISVTVSAGPDYVEVPSVVGDTVSKATAAIKAAGFTVGAVYGPGTGEVFTSDPLAGQKEKLGTAVALYTETPPTGPSGGATTTTSGTGSKTANGTSTGASDGSTGG